MALAGRCGERLRVAVNLVVKALEPRRLGAEPADDAHAQGLAAAARERQPRPALEAVSKLQSACVGCHVEFRKRLLERFYPLQTKWNDVREARIAP